MGSNDIGINGYASGAVGYREAGRSVSAATRRLTFGVAHTHQSAITHLSI